MIFGLLSLSILFAPYKNALDFFLLFMSLCGLILEYLNFRENKSNGKRKAFDLFGLAIFYIITRVFFFNDFPLREDEIHQLTSFSSGNNIIEAAISLFNMPVSLYTQNILFQIFGENIWPIKLNSLLWGFFLLSKVYDISQLFNLSASKKWRFLPSLLFCFHPYFINLSLDGRPSIAAFYWLANVFYYALKLKKKDFKQLTLLCLTLFFFQLTITFQPIAFLVYIFLILFLLKFIVQNKADTINTLLILILLSITLAIPLHLKLFSYTHGLDLNFAQVLKPSYDWSFFYKMSLDIMTHGFFYHLALIATLILRRDKSCIFFYILILGFSPFAIILFNTFTNYPPLYHYFSFSILMAFFLLIFILMKKGPLSPHQRVAFPIFSLYLFLGLIHAPRLVKRYNLSMINWTKLYSYLSSHLGPKDLVYLVPLTPIETFPITTFPSLKFYGDFNFSHQLVSGGNIEMTFKTKSAFYHIFSDLKPPNGAKNVFYLLVDEAPHSFYRKNQHHEISDFLNHEFEKEKVDNLFIIKTKFPSDGNLLNHHLLFFEMMVSKASFSPWLFQYYEVLIHLSIEKKQKNKALYYLNKLMSIIDSSSYSKDTLLAYRPFTINEKLNTLKRLVQSQD